MVAEGKGSPDVRSVLVPLILVVWLPVGMMPPPAAGMAAGEPGNQAAPRLPASPRISAELRDLAIEDAAARLESILRVKVHVPPRLPAGGDAAPSRLAVAPPVPGNAPDLLDYERRGSFSWKDVPVADALREFCRHYRCSLGMDYRGNLTVSPIPLATGPTASAGDYQVRVEALNYTDSRSVDALGEFTARRNLSLQFAIRAVSAHVARIHSLENIRVEDQAGRDVLEKPAPGQLPGPAAPRAFPDERGQTVRLEWPYPRPERLRLIEGDLLLYRRVSLQQVEIAVPAPGQISDIVESGDVHCQLVQVDSSAEGLRVTLRLMCPAEMGVLLNAFPATAEIVLPKGQRVPMVVTGMGWGMSEGWKSMDFSLAVAGQKDVQGKLRLRFLRQERPDRRVHFRLTDFPYPLSPGLPASGGQSGGSQENARGSATGGGGK